MTSNDPLLASFPGGESRKVLLLTCCAPCVVAAAEALHALDVDATLYFYNPNIQPEDEYLRRRDEVARIASRTGVKFEEGAYEPELWHEVVRGVENTPERGERCRRCFTLRLNHAAQYAADNSFNVLASVLSFSRWKSAEMGETTLRDAVANVSGVTPWIVDWRKSGRQERTVALIRKWNIYNQIYCGCPYSKR